jgi:hypothetical protein
VSEINKKGKEQMINKLHILRIIKGHHYEKKDIEIEIDDIVRVDQFITEINYDKSEVREYIESLPHQRKGNTYYITLNTIEKAQAREFLRVLYEGLFYADEEVRDRKISKETYEIYRQVLKEIGNRMAERSNMLMDVCMLVRCEIGKLKKSEIYVKELGKKETYAYEVLSLILMGEYKIKTDKKEIIQEIKRRIRRYDVVYETK